MKRVLITGADGLAAGALTGLRHDLTLTDLKAKSVGNKFPDSAPFYVGDLTNFEFCEQITRKKQVVVHLGGSSRDTDTWENILENNIIALEKLLKACVKNGTQTFIYASSNHIVRGYETDNEKVFHHEFNQSNLIDENVPVRPHSYYGVSKVFGEALGRYYYERFGITFIGLRIGSVLPEQYDHAYGYAEQALEAGELNSRNDKKYQWLVNRLRSTYLSRRDFLHLIECCIDYNQHPDFFIANAVSNNSRRWLNIDTASNKLGFNPVDNAEDHSKYNRKRK